MGGAGIAADQQVRARVVSHRAQGRAFGGGQVAILEYVDWFNHRRLYEACGDIPPAELETAYYRQNAALSKAGQTTN